MGSSGPPIPKPGASGSTGAAGPDPYARIAAWYDAEFDEAGADVGTFARALDGARRVLVLGCGTGRVSEGLRAAGREVVGVDLSGPMIARAQARAARSTVGTARYAVGDMCTVGEADLGRFDVVVIPNAAFAFLPTRRDQSRCLRAVRALTDGAAWIDLPMPDFALLGAAHTPEAHAWAGMVDGLSVRRTREVWREPVAQRLDLLDRYYVGADASVESLLRLRLVYPAELEWMLESTGWCADELFGDHAGGRVREGCDRLLVRAV